MFKETIYRELWAVHEFYRKLGFPSDNIFVAIDNRHVLGCTLAYNGTEYTITLGEIDQDPMVFRENWTVVCETINDGTVTDAELDDAWVNSRVLRCATDILMSMAAKGLQPIYNKN